jgi:hypothetical protein
LRWLEAHHRNLDGTGDLGIARAWGSVFLLVVRANITNDEIRRECAGIMATQR